jgi:AAA-like domain/TIR domain
MARDVAWDVFISYAREDFARIQPWVQRLKNAGVSVWIDQECVDGGLPWTREVVKAIHNCKVLVLMGSPASVASEQVITEISLAKESKKGILPIYLEPIEALPAELEWLLARIHYIELYRENEAAQFAAILRALAQWEIRVNALDLQVTSIVSRVRDVSDPRLRWIEQACAYIETAEEQGTGYLVTSDRVVTSAQVVRSVGPGGRVSLRFPAGAREAVVERLEACAGYAVLRLETSLPASVRPLRRAVGCPEGATWKAYGFPGRDGGRGVLIEGQVRSAGSKEPHAVAPMQLYCPEIGAGLGVPPHALSGAPVVVKRAVVGHLTQVDVENGGQAGLIAACPIGQIDDLPPFVNRGPVEIPPPPPDPYDPNHYVHRWDDEITALVRLMNRSTVVLLGPKHIGKTTFLDHLLHRACQQNWVDGKMCRLLRINLDEFDEDSKRSLDALLEDLARRIVRDLGESEDRVTTAWNRRGGAPLKMTGLLEQILPQAKEQLILAIARVEAVWKYAFLDDFFGLLRSWSENVQEPWSRLRLVLEVSTAPTLLTKKRSRFNVAPPIPIGDFDKVQVGELADLYALNWGEQDIRELMRLVGGHPFLVRQAMYHARQRRKPLREVLRKSHTSDGIFADHLDSLLSPLEEQPDLLKAVYQVARNPASEIDIKTYDLLHCAGLIVRDGSRYRFRYQLYRRYIQDRSAQFAARESA